jgi:hypothetical protein
LTNRKRRNADIQKGNTMLRSTQNLKTLRTSTALMLALALVAPYPMSAMAQQADAPELDCAADSSDPACGTLPEASELPIEDALPPAEETPTAEPVVDELQAEEVAGRGCRRRGRACCRSRRSGC